MQHVGEPMTHFQYIAYKLVATVMVATARIVTTTQSIPSYSPGCANRHLHMCGFFLLVHKSLCK